MNKLKLILGCIAALFYTPSFAAFNDAGTDYSNASSSVWVEDASNDFVSMAKSFACLIKNSRPDLNANSTWIAYVDETECGLSDASGKVLSKSISVSTRASATSPQEVVVYFDSSESKSKFIVNITLKSGADTTPPYGVWTFAYYMYENGQNLGTTYTSSTSPVKGIVDVKVDGSDIVLLGYDSFNDGSGEEIIASKFGYIGGSTDTAKFIGYVQDSSGNKIGMTGKTSASNYYSVSAPLTAGNEINSGAISAACYKRGNTFTTSYRSKLYNGTTGAEIKLTGPFPFTTSSSRGWFDRWGVWVEGGSSFTPSASTLSITSETDSSSKTLQWAAGRLLDANYKPVSAKETYALAGPAGTAFTCASNCLVGDSGSTTKVPLTYSAIDATSEKIPAYKASGPESYIFTSLNAPSGYEKLMLYHDLTGNGLTSDDKAVRFDFSTEFAAGNRKYVNYTNPAAAQDASLNNYNVWMVLADSSSAVFNWQAGSDPWNHATAAINSDASLYAMDDPIVFTVPSYAFATNDMNSLVPTFTFKTKQPSNNSTISGFKSCGAADSDGISTCTITGANLNGSRKFSYNGMEVRSEDVDDEEIYLSESTNNWFKPLNLKTGTTVTDAIDPNKSYVIKNLESGEYFIPEASDTLCAADSLTYSTLSALGYDTTDVPSLSDYTLPSQTWADKPSETGLACIVTMGEAGSGC